MPEIAVMGALEGLDVMLNDALYGILFRDINMQRTLVDQFMSRVINGFAGVIINTGEDNYLTTADAVEEAHTVLASDLINEQLALLAGLPEEQMGLGHAFEMDPMLENGFLYELAQAQMTRENFSEGYFEIYASDEIYDRKYFPRTYSGCSFQYDRNLDFTRYSTVGNADRSHTYSIYVGSLSVDRECPLYFLII